MNIHAISAHVDQCRASLREMVRTEMDENPDGFASWCDALRLSSAERVSDHPVSRRRGVEAYAAWVAIATAAQEIGEAARKAGG